MKNILEIITAQLNHYLKLAFDLNDHQLSGLTIELISDSKKENFGDITTNAALVIAKIIKKNPVLVAQKIINEYTHEAIEHSVLAGPGFINITLKNQAFVNEATAIFEQQSEFFKLDVLDKKISYNIEFVSANPTGPLHIGHGRGGIMGDVLARVLSFLGHSVTKEYYINDAGKQIEKLGTCFKIRCQQQLGSDVVVPEDGYQGEYLVQLACKALQEHRAQIDQAFAAQDDVFFARYAQDYLLQAIKETLGDYGITFDVWFSEYSLHASGAVEKALNLLEKNGYAFMQDDALWFRSTAFGDDKDRVLRRSNGEVTYAAADVAYLQNKIDRGFEQIIMILGQDHHSYVQRMKGIMEALGHNAANLDVPLYQLVTLKESGELLRMSKRAGRMVTLHDIIQTVGTDVARFFYLNRKADAHLEFDIDLAVKKTEENPVYYMQYAYVRTKSIIEKAYEHSALQDIVAADFGIFTEREKLLLKKIMSLKTILNSISKNYHTHLLTYYVLELAHEFHGYYASHRVVDGENVAISRSRLALITVLQKTFELCMELMGITCPEKM